MTATYPSRGRAAYALIVLTLVGFVLTTDLTLTALLIEPMKRDLQLSDVQVALVQGTAYGLALGLSSMPMGRLIDVFARRTLIMIGIAAWTAALITIGLSGGIATVMIGRVVLGLVAALVVPAVFSMGADLYPVERRAVATSLLVVGQALGQAFGMLAGGKAFDALTNIDASVMGLPPWRVLYLAAASLGLLLLVFLARLREPVRQERDRSRTGLSAAAGELWSYRRFLLPLLLGLLFAQITIQSASVWASPALIRRGLTPGMFAGWMSAVLLIGGVVGAFSSGWLAELGRRRRGRGGVLLPGVILAIVIAPASTFILVQSLPLFATLLTLDIFAGAVVATAGAIAITLVLPNEIRGLAMGVDSSASAIFGAAGAPTAVALLSRYLGGEQHPRPRIRDDLRTECLAVRRVPGVRDAQRRAGAPRKPILRRSY